MPLVPRSNLRWYDVGMASSVAVSEADSLSYGKFWGNSRPIWPSLRTSDVSHVRSFSDRQIRVRCWGKRKFEPRRPGVGGTPDQISGASIGALIAKGRHTTVGRSAKKSDRGHVHIVGNRPDGLGRSNRHQMLRQLVRCREERRVGGGHGNDAITWHGGSHAPLGSKASRAQ